MLYFLVYCIFGALFTTRYTTALFLLLDISQLIIPQLHMYEGEIISTYIVSIVSMLCRMLKWHRVTDLHCVEMSQDETSGRGLSSFLSFRLKLKIAKSCCIVYKYHCHFVMCFSFCCFKCYYYFLH